LGGRGADFLIEGEMMARFSLPLVAFLASLSAAFAEGAQFTPALPCRAAASIVASRGAVLLATGGGKYDRYVSGGNACLRDEELRPAWVQTADNASCFIGYTCEPFFSNRR
jgi:hypothetical protein